jgi:hypothetical protein
MLQETPAPRPCRITGKKRHRQGSWAPFTFFFAQLWTVPSAQGTRRRNSLWEKIALSQPSCDAMLNNQKVSWVERRLQTPRRSDYQLNNGSRSESAMPGALYLILSVEGCGRIIGRLLEKINPEIRPPGTGPKWHNYIIMQRNPHGTQYDIRMKSARRQGQWGQA